jgi:transcriptional regulator
MGYAKTDKRLKAEAKQTDWQQRMEIMRLKIQGWSDQKIADKLGCSRQNVSSIYHKFRYKTVSELEGMMKLANK